MKCTPDHTEALLRIYPEQQLMRLDLETLELIAAIIEHAGDTRPLTYLSAPFIAEHGGELLDLCRTRREIATALLEIHGQKIFDVLPRYERLFLCLDHGIGSYEDQTLALIPEA